MYAVMGWALVLFLLIMTAPWYLRLINQHFFSAKSEALKKAIKQFRRFHKPLGLIVLFVGPIHGYLALGTLKLHTGLLLWFSLLVMAVLGGSFYKSKKKVFFTWHKRILILVVCMFLLHLFFPSAVYYLFR